MKKKSIDADNKENKDVITLLYKWFPVKYVLV